MLSQLAKLASRLDTVGLTKEADVLDAFIKRAADGEYSEVSGEYHPSEEEEEMFGKWHDDGDSRTEKENRLSRLISELSDVDKSNIDGLSDEDLDYLLRTAKSILTDKNDWESVLQRSPRSSYSPLYGGG